MAKERTEKEVENLISIEGEKGFLAFDEANGLPANDIVSSDQIDDVLMMFDEMDIDVMDDLQGLNVEEEKMLEKEEEEAEEFEVESLWQGHGSRSNVSPGDGVGLPPHPGGRGRDCQKD